MHAYAQPTRAKRAWWRAIVDDDDLDFWFQGGMLGLSAFLAMMLNCVINIYFIGFQFWFALGGPLGNFTGILAAVFVSIFEGKAWFSSRQAATRAGGFFLKMLAAAAFFVSLSSGSALLKGYIEDDQALTRQEEKGAELTRERADSLRDSSTAQATLDEARNDLQIARDRLAEINAWKGQIAPIPLGARDDAVAEVQRLVGTDREGNRLAIDGIAGERTSDAVEYQREQAQAAVDAAIIRRDEALAALTLITNRIASGEIAAVEAAAYEASTRVSLMPTLRSVARLVTPGEERDQDVDHIDQLALNIGTGVAIAINSFISLASFILGNFFRPAPTMTPAQRRAQERIPHHPGSRTFVHAAAAPPGAPPADTAAYMEYLTGTAAQPEQTEGLFHKADFDDLARRKHAAQLRREEAKRKADERRQLEEAKRAVEWDEKVTEFIEQGMTQSEAERAADRALASQPPPPPADELAIPRNGQPVALKAEVLTPVPPPPDAPDIHVTVNTGPQAAPEPTFEEMAAQLTELLQQPPRGTG